jgi:hypothetical protein
MIVVNLYLSNIMAEYLVPLLHIQEVPASNLGPEAGYPDKGFL